MRRCALTLSQDNVVGPLCEDNDAASLAVLLGESSSLEGNLLNVCQVEALHLRELGCLLSEEHCVLKRHLVEVYCICSSIREYNFADVHQELLFTTVTVMLVSHEINFLPYAVWVHAEEGNVY